MDIKCLLTAATTAATVATGSFAGGIDRSGQNIGIIYEQGSFAKLSFGVVTPSVSGVFGGAVDSGNMAGDYTQFGLGFKTDLNDKFSLSFIMDQPFGANIDYPAGTGYPLAGSTAELKSTGLTLIGRYKFDDRFSVHAGLKHESISGVVELAAGFPFPFAYTLDVSSNSGIGYLAGAAYEIPEIALRAAITYSSGIDHTETGTELGGPESFEIRTPQSVNLEFQTGIAADTLLTASARWVDWSEFDISPTFYSSTPAGPLVSYEEDSISYSLGIGRRFSDKFSGSFAIGYEKPDGLTASNLGPTDGYYSVLVGGKYTMDNVSISGGVRYVAIGDAVTSSIGGVFNDNSALGVGLSIGYSF